MSEIQPHDNRIIDIEYYDPEKRERWVKIPYSILSNSVELVMHYQHTNPFRYGGYVAKKLQFTLINGVDYSGKKIRITAKDLAQLELYVEKCDLLDNGNVRCYAYDYLHNKLNRDVTSAYLSAFTSDSIEADELLTTILGTIGMPWGNDVAYPILNRIKFKKNINIKNLTLEQLLSEYGELLRAGFFINNECDVQFAGVYNDTSIICETSLECLKINDVKSEQTFGWDNYVINTANGKQVFLGDEIVNNGVNYVINPAVVMYGYDLNDDIDYKEFFNTEWEEEKRYKYTPCEAELTVSVNMYVLGRMINLPLCPVKIRNSQGNEYLIYMHNVRLYGPQLINQTIICDSKDNYIESERSIRDLRNSTNGATHYSDGLMCADDKIKLDGLPEFNPKTNSKIADIFTPNASNCTCDFAQIAVSGNIAQLLLRIQPKEPIASGNVKNVIIGKIGSKYLPKITKWSTSGEQGAIFYVNTSGQVAICATNTGITAGQNVYLSCTYILA